MFVHTKLALRRPSLIINLQLLWLQLLQVLEISVKTTLCGSVG